MSLRNITPEDNILNKNRSTLPTLNDETNFLFLNKKVKT